MMCNDRDCDCRNEWESRGSEEYKNILKKVRLKEAAKKKICRIIDRIENVITELSKIKMELNRD